MFSKNYFGKLSHRSEISWFKSFRPDVESICYINQNDEDGRLDLTKQYSIKQILYSVGKQFTELKLSQKTLIPNL